VCCPPPLAKESGAADDPGIPLGFEQARVDLKSALRRATSVIVCRPIVSPRDAPADGHFLALSTFVGDSGGLAAFPALESIVIAFTYYEMAFAMGYAGTPEFASPSAAASDPGRALDVMSRSIQGTRFIGALRRLIEVSQRHGRLRIVCVPISSFGFLASDGSANVDLWSGNPADRTSVERKPLAPELRLPPLDEVRRSEILAEDLAAPALASVPAPLVVERRGDWVPFHTLDPIVACLSGEKGHLTFDAVDVLAHARLLEAQLAR
jgi:hypothetical protein